MPFAARIAQGEALVHSQRCPYFRNRSADGWVGGYPSRHEARDVARAKAKQVRYAKCCLGGVV